MKSWRMLKLIGLVCCFTALTAIAQTTPTTAPAADAKPITDLKARVVQVEGTVEFAPLDAEPMDRQAWKPVMAGMELEAGTQIRTGLRSQCVLLFGKAPDDTVISIRRATLASISDFYRTENEQRVRLGLGYGAIRGGTSEGTLRSDVVIDSPVATLAKRGTEGFEMRVERVSGRFTILLAESGLVEARSNMTGETQLVGPDEYVTDETIAKLWINQDIFDRAIRFYEVEMLTDSELWFTSLERTGLSNMAPAARELFEYGQRRNIDVDFTRMEAFNGDLFRQFQFLLLQQSIVRRPEGNYGLGQTLRVLAPRRAGMPFVRGSIRDFLRPRRAR